MHATLSSIPKQHGLGTGLCDTCIKWAFLKMEDQSESLPGPSALASASAGSTQDEYAESIDSDEALGQNNDLESEGRVE